MFTLFLPGSAQGLAAPLTVTTMTATIAAGFMLARYAGSRLRAAARERVHDFEYCLGQFVAGHTRGRKLLFQASRLEPDDFWESVSSLATHLTRRAFRDVEQALERSRHVGAERRALIDGPPLRRELAARRLANLGAARHRHALRRALVAGPEPVTLAAGTALARIRDGATLRWLLEHPSALEHRTPVARFGLLRAFGRGAAPRLHAALVQKLSEPRMERAVIEALAAADRREAADLIASRLGHPWRDVRVAAARALGRLGAGEHRAGLVAALEDSDWRVRSQAARSLGRLSAREAIPALGRTLSDASWWVRRHSAYALAALGEEGQRALREAAAAHTDRYARDIAAEALAGGFPPRR